VVYLQLTLYCLTEQKKGLKFAKIIKTLVYTFSAEKKNIILQQLEKLFILSTC